MRSRMYYEFCRVADFPHITVESRKEQMRWYWDNGLSPNEVDAREEYLENIREQARQHYAKPAEALKFFAQGGLQK